MLNYAEKKKIDMYIEVLDTVSIPIFQNTELTQKHSWGVNDNLEDVLAKIRDWHNKRRSVLIDEKGITFISKWLSCENITGCCPLGITDLFLESNGNIRTGCWVLPSVGNIRNESLNSILANNKYKVNLDRMSRRDCPGCTCGYLMQAKYMDNG